MRCRTAIWLIVAALMVACGDGSSGEGDMGAGAGETDAGGNLSDVSEADTGAAADTSTPEDSGEADTTPDPDTASPDAADTASPDIGAACPGSEGCPCTENGDCDNAACIDTPDGKRCAKTCVEDCPKGYSCGKLGKDDANFVCIPDHLTTCSPCTTNADCQYQQADALCLDYGDIGRFCGGPCKVDSDCPTADYACIDVLDEGSGQTKKQCKRKPKVTGGSGTTCTQASDCAKGETCEDGKCATTAFPSCECNAWAKAAAKSSPCKVSNDFGTCSGTRTCSASGLTACSALTPSEEDCDTVDDDCNGMTDDLPPTVTCSEKAWLPLGSKATCTDDAGCTEAGESCDPSDGLCKQFIGACPGKPTCKAGKIVCEDAKTPKVEACNGDDDDCDGAADEDFAWENPATGAKVVVGGACGLGPCAGGLVQCETLLAAACTTEKSNKKAEACNGVDDDCDGQTDDETCVDGSECTADVCDPKTGACSNPATVTCDDNNPCTTDSCDKAAGKCVFTPYEGSCDDGDACTVGDACGKDGDGKPACLPGATTKDCDDDNVCTDDSCDKAKGCVQLPNAMTQACYTGAQGTEGAGTCKGGVRYCKDGKLGADCVGEVTPNGKEQCDGVDDTCDGTTDEGCKAGSVAGSFAGAFGTVSGKTTQLTVELGGSSPTGRAQGKGKVAELHSGFIAWLMSVWQ